MELVRLCIPYQFIKARAKLSWQEVHFGLVNELLDPDAVAKLASDEISNSEHCSDALLHLAVELKGQVPQMISAVKHLSSCELPISEGRIKDKWLYLVLAWTYVNRGIVPNPLQRIEEIYADFGYPEQISSFVRYMPMVGPDLGSREANESRLLERWRQYLETFESTH